MAGGNAPQADGLDAPKIYTEAFLCPTEEREQVFCDADGKRVDGLRRSTLKNGWIDDTVEDGIRTYSRRYNALGMLIEEYSIADGTKVENPKTYYDNGRMKKSENKTDKGAAGYDRDVKIYADDGVLIYEMKEVDAGTIGEMRRETFTDTSIGWLRSIANGHYMFDSEAVYYDKRGERPSGQVVIYNETGDAWQEFLLRNGFIDGQKIIMEENKTTDGMYRRGRMYKETTYYTKDENGGGLPVTFPDESDTMVEYDREELSVYGNGTKSVLYMDGKIIMGRCFGNRTDDDVESFYAYSLDEKLGENDGIFKCQFDEDD
jgi:antitoxin component YwqK of YwqJK toxin-antitoxin module